MSYFTRRTNKFTTTKLQSKEARLAEYRNKKGFWEYNFYVKNYKPDDEAKKKNLMKPNNCFDPTKIDSYINPQKSREDIITEKKDKGEKLNSREQIIYDNYISTRLNAIKKDFDAVTTQGINANVHTIEGKTKRLLHTLGLMLKKKNIKMISNIYLRLQEDQFLLTPELNEEYSKQIQEMNKIVKDLDMIKLQFTDFHSQMPPLNIHGFKKFDQWQIDVIHKINQGESIFTIAPTSAGKTVLAGYAVIKGRVLFVVPTDALAWQVSAYLGGILNKNIPILTQTYQTHPARKEMIKILNNSNAIVGTPETIVDFLPSMTIDFTRIILDEIHMIGKPEGSAMEYIIKVIKDVPILALSATVGNPDKLVSWLRNISPSIPISIVSCTKRFFNLQRYAYNNKDNTLISLHPLAMIDEEQIADESILTRSLQPTPPNAWDLAMKLMKKYDLKNLDPYVLFGDGHRIELTEAYDFFNNLIKFICLTYKTDPTGIMEIINDYKQEELVSSSTDILQLAFKLKSLNKTPAIIFQENTLACLRMVRQFARDIEKAEEDEYPNLLKERLKQKKAEEKLEKKACKSENNNNEKSTKKELKQMMGTVTLKKDKYGSAPISETSSENILHISLQEPQEKYILNDHQYFPESVVEEWVEELKKYFPNTGDFYHFIIMLLWRGVGVYTVGLPDPYLRLVQTLACKKQLAIVFSDQSLVFGVSMPFRTVVVIRDKHIDDNLDSMLFQQMSGRAGRRGLDIEGNVIFAGYSWDRIRELSISPAPIVEGVVNIINTVLHGNKLSQINKTGQNWNNTCINFLDSSCSDDDGLEFLESIKSNYENSWNFGLVENDSDHLNMCWRLRYGNNDALIVSYIFKYLHKAFNHKDPTMEINQIEIAHLLCRFLDTEETTISEFVLCEPDLLSFDPYSQISSKLEELQIDIPNRIDNRVFISIKNNNLVTCENDIETDKVRQRLLDFSTKIIHIQHYCFHNNINGLCRLLGKLLTRNWWIYHLSSPIMKPFGIYEDITIIDDDDDDNDDDDENKESDNEDN